MLYGSGNRDERHYPDPDRFDASRNPTDHLTFGYGTHGCAGQALAKIEAHAVLRALASRVRRFEVGEPVRHLNNTVRGCPRFRCCPSSGTSRVWYGPEVRGRNPGHPQSPPFVHDESFY